MRPRMRSLLLIVFVIVAGSFSPVLAQTRQTATPTTEIVTQCGGPITINGAPRGYPADLDFLGGCETYSPLDDRYTISAQYRLTAGTFITSGGVADEQELHQYGVTRIDIVEGSLIVGLVQLCPWDLPCLHEGAVFYARDPGSGPVVWQPLGLNADVTLNPGDAVWLENVKATFQAGPSGALFTTFGTFSESDGQGCGTVCFHSP